MWLRHYWKASLFHWSLVLEPGQENYFYVKTQSENTYFKQKNKITDWNRRETETDSERAWIAFALELQTADPVHAKSPKRDSANYINNAKVMMIKPWSEINGPITKDVHRGESWRRLYREHSKKSQIISRETLGDMSQVGKSSAWFGLKKETARFCRRSYRTGAAARLLSTLCQDVLNNCRSRIFL